jgi:hypothetical protein
MALKQQELASLHLLIRKAMPEPALSTLLQRVIRLVLLHARTTPLGPVCGARHSTVNRIGAGPDHSAVNLFTLRQYHYSL